MRRFRYLYINYHQTKDGYRFYLNWKDKDKEWGGITINDLDNIIPVLNFYGNVGLEFICWDECKLLFKEEF